MRAFTSPVSVLPMLACLASLTAAQSPAPPAVEALHRPFDELLDINVRDGLVYYPAIRSDRRRLDAYVASLDGASIANALANWPREQQAAFWVNAYNAFVLQTVVNNYPIRGRAPQYPPQSIRQIPGAFERLPHRAAGRAVTLDQIEKTILLEFHDPRLYLALGRGAFGSGRLRSEAYTGARLETQLKQVAAEFATRAEYLRVDRAGNAVTVTPIIGWHEAEFIDAYSAAAQPVFSTRSPIERAILAFIGPNLLPMEREFIDKNEFKVSYHDFDWRLNDLSAK